LVAAITRMSIWMGAGEPTRLISRFSSTRSQLHLHAERQLAQLVEEDRAAVGRFEEPDADRGRRR
jgi:hypothetical protein